MPPLDRQPRLEGPTLRLRPVTPDDFDALYAIASDPLLWAQHPSSDRYQPDVFRRFFDDAVACGGGLVIERHDGELLGSTRYDNYDEAAGEVEIGWTFIARSCWGGGVNDEVKRLMLEHAFGAVERVVFLVGPENRRSRRAVEKLGAREAGTRRDNVLYELRRAWWDAARSGRA